MREHDGNRRPGWERMIESESKENRAAEANEQKKEEIGDAWR